MKKLLEKCKNKKAIIALVAMLGIILTTAGISVAWFSYSRNGTKSNTIKSGNITFHYQEGNRSISLIDAMPMTDQEGKQQSNYFDFEITADTVKDINIPYVVTARVDSSSTLPMEHVKIYLTDQNNNQIEPVRFFDSGSTVGKIGLAQYSGVNANNHIEKVIYEGNVPMNRSNYSKAFRVRVWIADDIDMNANGDGISTYNGATFKVTFNVYSEGLSLTESEENARSNANIDTLTVASENLTSSDGIHYEKTDYILSNQTSKTATLEIETENPNATVTVEKVDSLGINVASGKIKKLSVSKTITLTPGTNYFKIAVRPEDKSEPTIYYLTINVITEYTITYNLDGGTQVANPVTSYNVNSETFYLPNPTKENYIFGGWYESSEFTGQAITQVTTGTIGDKVYYAKWDSPPKLTEYLRSLSSSDVVQNDTSGDSNMRFVGASPSNYIRFILSDGTKETWRIIGVFNQNSHGYNGDLVKIVRNSSIGRLKYNSAYDNKIYTYSNNWNTATLKNDLNSNTYKYAASNYAQSVTWKTGAISWGGFQDNGPNAVYQSERSNTASLASTSTNGYQTTSTGVVALPYYSDLFHSTDGNNGATSRSTCVSQKYANNWTAQEDETSKGNCDKGAWLWIKAVTTNSSEEEMWTLNSRQDTNCDNFILGSNSIGAIGGNSLRRVYPTLYLNNNVRCTNCGDTNVGTSSNPYEIMLP